MTKFLIQYRFSWAGILIGPSKLITWTLNGMRTASAEILNNCVIILEQLFTLLQRNSIKINYRTSLIIPQLIIKYLNMQFIPIAYCHIFPPIYILYPSRESWTNDSPDAVLSSCSLSHAADLRIKGPASQWNPSVDGGLSECLHGKTRGTTALWINRLTHLPSSSVLELFIHKSVREILT